jgi:hypothetical protein
MTLCTKELVGAEEDRARPGVALPPTLAKQGRSFDHNGDLLSYSDILVRIRRTEATSHSRIT